MKHRFVLSTIAAGIALPLVAAGIVYLLPVTSFAVWLLVFIAPYPLGAIYPSLFLWLWHPRLFLGEGDVPPRSFYGLIAASVVSVVWYAIGVRDGIRAQGSTVALSMLTANVIALAALQALMLVARRRESYVITLALHVLTGVWGLTLAFPAFGPVDG